MFGLRFTILISAGLMVLSIGTVFSQGYPNRPIRIVTTPVGGGSDITARQIAQAISGPLGQPVIVDNRGSTVIAADVVAKAPPDGYTLYVGASPVWILPLVQKTPYDIKDFAPVSLIDRSFNLFAVHPSLPVKSVKELIALAKAKPGDLNYASAGAMGNSHLAMEIFKSMAGVNITMVPYKGGAPAVTAVISNEVQIMINDVGLLAPQVKAGKLVALGVTSSKPSALFPGLPAVAATVPGFESGGMTGVLAPARTPAAILNRLHQEISRYTSRADVKEQYLIEGGEPVGSTPEEFAAIIKASVTRIDKLVKEGALKAY